MLDPTAPAYRPSLVSWNLTKMCNLQCPHCYMDAGSRAGRELTTDECFHVFDELHKLGTEMVILTGGEPLLRKDIYDIALHGSRLGMWVVMGTNGVLVDDNVAARMVDCGVKGVAISIDSVHADKHNAFRGGRYSWQHAVRALEACRKRGLQVLIQSTVMAMNRDEIPELLAFARAQGAWSFNLYFLVRTGRGQEMSDLTPLQTHETLSLLADVQNDYRPMLVRAKCAPQFKQIAYERGLGGLESGGCMAGTEYARITPEGDVTPCPYMTVVAGNVLEEGFSRVWSESPVLEELRDRGRLKGRCGRCEFNEMCGGCRCRAYAAFGDYMQEDPACTYEPAGRPLGTAAPAWNEAARARLERIPIRFIRNKVRRGLEDYALRNAIPVITIDVMDDALAGQGRSYVFGDPPAVVTKRQTRD